MTRAVCLVLIRLCVLLALGVSVALLIDYTSEVPGFCAVGSACDQIKQSFGVVAGVPVPAMGVTAFAGLLVLSLLPGPQAKRATQLAAIAGGVIAAGLIVFQAVAVGSFCKLCVMVDTSAMVAAVLGGLSLREMPEGEEPLSALSWGGLVVLAIGLPVSLRSIASTKAEVPREIMALWKPGHVNVIEFSDFECPFCRLAHPRIEAALKKAKGPVNIVRKSYPLPTHPNARPAARAFYCAMSAGKGDEMADRLFTQEDITAAGCERTAIELGLVREDYRACVGDKNTDAAIDADIAYIRAAGFKGLPTVWINDTRILGAQEQDKFDEAVAKANLGGVDSSSLTPIVATLVISGVVFSAGWGKQRNKPAPTPSPSPSPSPKKSAAKPADEDEDEDEDEEDEEDEEPKKKG